MQHEQEHPNGRQGWTTALILGVIALLFGILSLLGGGMMGWGMMGPGMMYGYDIHPWWGFLMQLFWALIIVGLMLFIAWLVRGGPAAMAGFGLGGSRALEILQERYAKGEITREQYEQVRHDLECRELG